MLDCKLELIPGLSTQTRDQSVDRCLACLVKEALKQWGKGRKEADMDPERPDLTGVPSSESAMGRWVSSKLAICRPNGMFHLE